MLDKKTKRELVNTVTEVLLECKHWVNGAGIWRTASGHLVALSPLEVPYWGDEIVGMVMKPATSPSDLLGPEAPDRITSHRLARTYARAWVEEFGDLTELELE